MGDISVIARRLQDGRVQYGWSGNGGYYRSVGAKLLEWYREPDIVEYLFGLGQLRHLGKPHSEEPDSSETFMLTNFPTGEEHDVGPSERWMFNGTMFVDFGYFYDRDNRWYYVLPTPFRIKIPLQLIANNLDEEQFEFDFTDSVKAGLVRYLLGDYLSSHEDLYALIESHDTTPEEMLANAFAPTVYGGPFPINTLCGSYRWFFECFDDWVVVIPSAEDCSKLTYVVKRRLDTEERDETIDWIDVPDIEVHSLANNAIDYEKRDGFSQFWTAMRLMYGS